MNSFNDENKPAAVATKPTATDGNPLASDNKQKLFNMDRKFRIGNASIPNPDRDNSLGFRPLYICFYGTLMDPTQLQKVLSLENLPTLQAASTIGWRVMLWGQYPASVFKPSNVIHGMAYEV